MPPPSHPHPHPHLRTLSPHTHTPTPTLTHTHTRAHSVSQVRVERIIAEESYVFKSAMQPLKVSFKVMHSAGKMTPRITKDGKDSAGEGAGGVGTEAERESLLPKVFGVIYKVGDDLRRDQVSLLPPSLSLPLFLSTHKLSLSFSSRSQSSFSLSLSPIVGHPDDQFDEHAAV